MSRWKTSGEVTTKRIGKARVIRIFRMDAEVFRISATIGSMSLIKYLKADLESAQEFAIEMFYAFAEFRNEKF